MYIIIPHGISQYTCHSKLCIHMCSYVHVCVYMEARRQQGGLVPVTFTFCFSLASGSLSKLGWVTSKFLRAAFLSLSPQHWDHSVNPHILALFPWVLWLQLKQDFTGARIFPAPCDFFKKIPK